MPRKAEYWRKKLRRGPGRPKRLSQDFGVPRGCEQDASGLSLKRPPPPSDADRAARVAIYLKRVEETKRRASLFDPPLMASEVG